MVRAFPPFEASALQQQLRVLHAPDDRLTAKSSSSVVSLLDVYHRAMGVAATFGKPSRNDKMLRHWVARREYNYVEAAHLVASILVSRRIDLHWTGEPIHVTAFLDRITNTLKSPQFRGMSSSDIQLFNVCCVVLIRDPRWADLRDDDAAMQRPSSWGHMTGMPAGDKRARDEHTNDQKSSRPRIAQPNRNDNLLPPGLMDMLLDYMPNDSFRATYLEATAYRYVNGGNMATAFSGIWKRFTIQQRVRLTRPYDGPFKLVRASVSSDDMHLMPTTVVDVCIESSDGNPFQAPPVCAIPTHITHLTLHKQFNDPFVCTEPCKITHFEMGEIFNAHAILLPASVTHCIMGHAFTKEFAFAPGSALVSLEMGDSFNQASFRLPNALAHFVMGDMFNPLRNGAALMIPASLVELTMGRSFNAPIVFAPQSQLQTCTMGPRFNSPNLMLPDSVVTFAMGDTFNQELGMLPASLQTLVISDHYQHSIVLHPSCRLTHVTLGHACTSFVIPETVTHVETNTSFDRPLPYLPRSVVSLTLGAEFNQPDTVIPNTIIELTVEGFFTKTLVFEEPCRVQELNLVGDFNGFGLVVPRSVTHFTMGDEFKRTFRFATPSALVEFHMGHGYNRRGLQLPPTLRTFMMGQVYNQPDLHLPASVKHFTMGMYFNQPFTFDADIDLDHLEIGESFDQPDFELPTAKIIVEPEHDVVVTVDEFDNPISGDSEDDEEEDEDEEDDEDEDDEDEEDEEDEEEEDDADRETDDDGTADDA